MSYHISSAVYEHEIKKSRFIAYIQKITTPERFKSWLLEVKTQYPDARHWVSCCLIGAINNPDWLFLDDDGEPSGTGAKPLLNVVTHNDIADVGIIVVRYFGGIKLGAGGLVRAYGASATGVLDLCIKNKVVPVFAKRIKLSFHEEPAVRRILEAFKVSIEQDYLQDGVILSFSISIKDEEEITRKLNEKLNREFKIESC